MGRSNLYVMIFAAAFSLTSSITRAQIFVAANEKLGEFDFAGAPINPQPITVGDPWAITESAGQLFVANFNFGNISSYSAAGTLINQNLTLNTFLDPLGVAASGTDLFTVSYNNDESGTGTICEYTTSGAMVAAPLVSGLNDPYGIAAATGFLYVTDFAEGVISKYTTSGALVDATLVTGLQGPIGIAVSGDTIFVTNDTGTIGAYDATTGTTINAALISDLGTPWGLTVSGEHLFVTNIGNGLAGGGSVGEYTTSGATVNASLITGLDFPKGVAVVPEPATATILAVGTGILLL